MGGTWSDKGLNFCGGKGQILLFEIKFNFSVANIFFQSSIVISDVY